MRKVLIVLLVLVLALIGGGFALPTALSVERSRLLPCAPEAIFVHVNSLRRTRAWSPWQELDPGTENLYSGPDEGVGAKQEWKGQKSGSGTQEITSSSPNQEVRSRLFFKDFGSGADAHIRLARTELGTNVSWGFTGDPVGNPMLRYFNALYMKSALSKQYDRGLELLERAACG